MSRRRGSRLCLPARCAKGSLDDAEDAGCSPNNGTQGLVTGLAQGLHSCGPQPLGPSLDPNRVDDVINMSAHHTGAISRISTSSPKGSFFQALPPRPLNPNLSTLGPAQVDDVINVSGHRIGTAEVESALTAHPECVEAAVIGWVLPWFMVEGFGFDAAAC